MNESEHCPACVSERGKKEETILQSYRNLFQAAGAALLYGVGVLVFRLGDGAGVQTVVFLLRLFAYGLSAWNILLAAGKNLAAGKVLDEFFLMSVASLSAFILGEHAEAIAVMALFQVGEFFQERAVDRSRRSIAGVLAMRSDTAHVVTPEEAFDTHPSNVLPGSVISIRPGERVPLDGTVIDGSGYIDTSPVTGESLPDFVRPGTPLYSGSINMGSRIAVRTTSAYEDSTASRIIRLVEGAGARKAASERFLSRFSRVYTPVVVGAALLLAFVPPLLLGGDFRQWIYRGLVFLVVSCPCALAVSVPLTVFAGIGAASRIGVLVKGGEYLETLARGKRVVFDKTGTLTTGLFFVSGILPSDGLTEADLLRLAAGAEEHSNHPLARAVVEEARKRGLSWKAENSEEVPGCGVSAVVDGTTVIAGSPRFLESRGVELDGVDRKDAAVAVAAGSRYAGRIRLSDRIKPDAGDAVRGCRNQGIGEILLLSGDTADAVEETAELLGIDEWHGSLLPHEKVEILERLLSSGRDRGALIAVGDGINDAPLLARADVGVAMGGLGSHAAVDASDVVIMSDEPSKVAAAVGIGKRTGRIVMENILFSLGVKAVILVLGVFVITPLWAAVFADVGVTLLVVLNALRALRIPKEWTAS